MVAGGLYEALDGATAEFSDIKQGWFGELHRQGMHFMSLYANHDTSKLPLRLVS